MIVAIAALGVMVTVAFVAIFLLHSEVVALQREIKYHDKRMIAHDQVMHPDDPKTWWG